MNARPNDPVTARWVLFGRSERDADAVGAALRTGGVTAAIAAGLVGLSPYAQRFAQSEVDRAVDGLLDLDAVHAIARAWSKHRKLEDARRRTRTAHGRELVELAAHDVVSKHGGHIDVLVDNLPRQRIDAELTLRVRLQGLVAEVANGRITAMRGGDAELEASLSVLKFTVAERRHTLATSVVLAGAVDRPSEELFGGSVPLSGSEERQSRDLGMPADSSRLGR